MSRSKWEEMTSYPKELVAAVKDARAEGAKREAAKKAAEYQAQAERSLASQKAAAPEKAEAPAKKGEDISIGGTIEKIKARKQMLSDL